jgi:hypothetical protein
MSTAHYAGLDEIGRPIGGESAEPKPKKTDEPSLETQLAVSRAETVQAERLLQDSRAGHAPPPPPEPAELGPPDPGKMPDPGTDPAGFEVWQTATRDRDRWLNEQHTEGVRSQAERTARSKEIVDDYLATRPNYRPIREQVTQCYREACGELGLTSLPGNTSSLDAIVDKKIRAMATAAASAVGDLPTGDPKGPKPEETPPGRTEGLSAGSSGARADSKAKKDDEEPAPIPLTKVMQKRQAESPFF